MPYAGYVAARPIKARRQPQLYGIASDREHHRRCRGRFLGRHRCRGAARRNED
jgi:hypothetical protein